MKKYLLSLVAVLLTCVSATAAVGYKIDASKAIDVAATELDGVTAVVTDLAGAKTWVSFSGGDGQDINANYTSVEMWGSASEYSTIKFFAVEGQDDDVYYIKFINANGEFYVPRGGWHDQSGCMNVTGNGNGLFVGGLNGQQGQDAPNAALWKVAKTDEGYTLYNIGKERYAVPGIGVTATETAVKLYSEFDSFDPEENGNYTGRIVNFAVNGADGWTCERPNGGNGPLLGGVSFEYWAGNASSRQDASFNYYQKISGLPAGKYVLGADMYNSSNGEGDGHEPNGNAGLYIANGENESFVGVTEDGDQLKPYTTQGINVNEGDEITIGVKSIGYMSARWFVADNFSLVRTGDVEAEAPVVAITEGEGTYTVTSTSADAALYYICKPYTWLEDRETPELVLQNDIEEMGSMIDSQETWELYDHMGMQPAPKTFTVADYASVYAGQQMFIVAANVGWDGEKLAVISNVLVQDFTVPGAPEAPEVSGITVNPNKQIVAMTFNAEDAAPTSHVAFALETADGTAVDVKVDGEYGQNYGDMIYTFEAPLEDGDYVLVLPAGSMTFSKDGEPFNAEIRVPFTVGEAAPSVAVEATINGEVALNSHSAVSAESLQNIEVSFDGVIPTEAKYTVYSMIEIAGEESSSWENNETLAEGELSLNGKGYAELEDALIFYVGNKYNVVITYTAGEENGTESFEINGSTEIPVIAEIAAVCGEEQVVLNSHSDASVESISALKVSFGNPADVKEVSYTISNMIQVVGEESTTWEVNETIAEGAISLNTIGYAELETPVVCEQGTKYQIAIKVVNLDGTEETVTYTFDGATVAPVVAEATLMVGEDGITLSDHSSVSVEKMDAIKVTFGNSVDVKEATVAIAPLIASVGEESTSWIPGEAEEFPLSINTIGYAEKEYTFMQGTKYQIEITVIDQNGAEDKVAYNVDGATIPMASTLESGKYYIQENVSGLFISNGSSWGTRSILYDNGICYDVVLGEDGLYTLKSGIKGADKALRPTDGFNDQSGAWQIIPTQGGYYMFNGEKYFTRVEDDVCPQFTVNVEEASVWSFISVEERIASLAEASATNPVDATFLIKGADFLNGDVANGAWSAQKVGGDNGRDNTLANNTNCESWNVTPNENIFNVYQTLNNIPNGIYRLKALGYTRLNGATTASADAYEEGTEAPAYLYANDVETPLPSIFSEAYTEAKPLFKEVTSTAGNVYYIPNGQNTAAVAFEDGKYQIEEIEVEVTDGTLTVGVKCEEGGSEWVVFDNFRLTYLGEAPTSTIEAYMLVGEEEAVNISNGNTSVESATGIEVVFDAIMPQAATYTLQNMILVTGEESSEWVANETIAEGEISINGKGYVEFEDAIIFNQGERYLLTIVATAAGETIATQSFEFNGATVAPVIAEAVLIAGEEQIALNNHSAVSVEKMEAIKVTFGNPIDVAEATVAISPMVAQETEEGTTFVPGVPEVFALSINTIGYAEKEYTFEQGVKYQIDINVTFTDGTEETVSYSVDGATEKKEEGEQHITVNYIAAGPVLDIIFEDQTDVAPSWNVDILLDGQKLNCEMGQEWNEIYGYPGAALAAGEHTIVFPVGSLVFNSQDNNDTEYTVTFTVSEETAIKGIDAATVKDGKFVKNGKVVIVKNGKKYTVNGTRM